MFAFRSLLMFAFLGLSWGSAIPMWEFLSRSEKMSYLYSMYVNQVDEYCQFSELENCNKELIRHGLKNLQKMPDDRLDAMDPYQRGANTIIWEAMVQGYDSLKKHRKPSSKPTTYSHYTTTSKPTSNGVFDDFSTDFENQAAASNRHETILQLNVRDNPSKSSVYSARPTTSIDRSTALFNRVDSTEYSYGPMVVRVHPDGRPVLEDVDKRPPVDEDYRQYMLSKTRIPDLAELEAEAHPYAVYVRPTVRNSRTV